LAAQDSVDFEQGPLTRPRRLGHPENIIRVQTDAKYWAICNLNRDGYNRIESAKSGRLAGTVTFPPSPIAFFTGIPYNLCTSNQEGLVKSLSSLENRTDENGTLFASIASCL
jgi:hypothetical protein